MQPEGGMGLGLAVVPPLQYAVQLTLTPELRASLVDARKTGRPVALRLQQNGTVRSHECNNRPAHDSGAISLQSSQSWCLWKIQYECTTT